MELEVNSTTEGPTNCTSPFSSQEFINVAIVKTAISCISLLICIFVIFLIALLRLWKFFSQRLILYLAITAICFTLADLTNSVDFNKTQSSFLTGWCAFSGFITQLSAWMILNCVTVITIYIFLRVVLRTNTERFERAYLLYIFLFPLTFNWVPFVQGSYGKAGVWCWIRGYNLDTCQVHSLGRWLQLILYYLPLYTLIFILLVLYGVIGVTIFRTRKKQLKQLNNPNELKVMKKTLNEVGSLIAYPLIFFVLNIPLLINRIHVTVNPNHPSLALWYLAGMALPLKGALTGIVFTFATLARREIMWADLWTRARGRSIKANEYPMNPDEVTDSISPYNRYKTKIKTSS